MTGALETWLKQRKLSVPQFAHRKVRCAPSTIYRIIWGEGRCSVDMFERVAKATGEEIEIGTLIKDFKAAQRKAAHGAKKVPGSVGADAD